MAEQAAEASLRRAGTRWRAVLTIIACLSVFDVTLGLTYPLLSLILEQRGIGSALIGANAAMTSLGMIASAPLVVPLARRIGSWRLALSAMALTALALVLFRLTTDLWAWFLLRVLLGVAVGILFSLTEAWINTLATAETRGRVMGLYASTLSLGFATGPFLLPLAGIDGWTPFAVGLAFIFAGALPLLLSRSTTPEMAKEERASLRVFAPKAPVLLTAVIAVAIFDTAIMSLLPIYGLRVGLTEETAAIALGTLLIGNVVLQPAIGWISDRTSPRAVLLACAALTAVGGVLVPVIVGTIWLWPFLLLWGATGFGVYTVALTELGARFSGAMLVTGAAAFSGAWGIGGGIGPLIGGAAMSQFGPHGLPLVLAATLVAPVVLGLLIRR